MRMKKRVAKGMRQEIIKQGKVDKRKMRNNRMRNSFSLFLCVCALPLPVFLLHPCGRHHQFNIVLCAILYYTKFSFTISNSKSFSLSFFFCFWMFRYKRCWLFLISSIHFRSCFCKAFIIFFFFSSFSSFW